MDGIIVVNKPSLMTSRDVVNKVSKILKTKKVGHTGTLDPLATGVLAICVGKATKLVDVITSTTKEYVAGVKVGVLTDTLDTEGNVLMHSNDHVSRERLSLVLSSFIGEYEQEVPIYSAVKVNGKKLYEYARSNQTVKLPRRKVKIMDVKLLEVNPSGYKFYVKVSKGTYIRSLIRDINKELSVIGVMSTLERVSQGKFKLKDSFTLEEIESGEYKLLSITDVLGNDDCVSVSEETFHKIKNGALIKNTFDKKTVTFMYDNKVIATYKEYDKDKGLLKPDKIFI